MDQRCAHCRAWLWEQELTVSKKGDRFAVCCKHGQVPLLAARAPPTELKALLENTDKWKTELFKQAVVWQLSLAVYFACPVVFVPGPRSDFRAQGAVSVMVGTIRARNDADARYVQVLFTTQVQQAAQRTSLLGDRNKELLLLVRRLICTHNPFYQIYKSVNDQGGAPGPDYRAVFTEDPKFKPTGAHARQYNAPNGGGAQANSEVPGGAVFTRNVFYREVLNG